MGKQFRHQTCACHGMPLVPHAARVERERPGDRRVDGYRRRGNKSRFAIWRFKLPIGKGLATSPLLRLQAIIILGRKSSEIE